MRRYTVILSDDSGYADYHVSAKDRKEAEAAAIVEHCKNDNEDEAERRESERAWQPHPIFIYHGWAKVARE